MKKLLALILALSAVFCFAGCEDGKCDDCKTKENVEVVEIKGEDVELCPSCAAKRAANNIIDGILG